MAACNNANRDDVATAADSAGVTNVTSPTPSGETATWTISATPVVSIGAAEGGSAQLLHRVYAATVLENGDILVSNSGTHELRVYSRDGTLKSSFGKGGQGPGEFETFASMRVYRVSPDTLAITNGDAVAVNIYTTAGQFVKGVSFPQVAGYGRAAPMGVFADKGWLTQMPKGTGRLGGEPGNRIEMSHAFFRYSVDAASESRLTDVNGRPRIVTDWGDGTISYPFVPLTPEPIFAVDGDDLLVNDNGEPEFRRIGRDGRVSALVRWSPARTPVAEIWKRYSDDVVASVEPERRPLYARLFAFDDLRVPTHVPAVQSIIVDKPGNVWVQKYRLPWEESRVWDVLSAEGAWLGEITTPPGVTVFEIGSDYLLGRHLDDLRVERVVVHSLRR